MRRILHHTQLAACLATASIRHLGESPPANNDCKGFEGIPTRTEETFKKMFDEAQYDPSMENDADIKAKLIQLMISKDKELFNLKRQHELSLLRIEQLQKRAINEDADKLINAEHFMNVKTFEDVSLSHYSRRNTFYHLLGIARLR